MTTSLVMSSSEVQARVIEHPGTAAEDVNRAELLVRTVDTGRTGEGRAS